MTKQTKKKKYWNYRVVAELEPDGKTWFYSIRSVYYTDDKPTSWGEEPQYPVSDESPIEMQKDIEAMNKAFLKPLLIVKEGKLIQDSRKHSLFAKVN